VLLVTALAAVSIHQWPSNDCQTKEYCSIMTPDRLWRYDNAALGINRTAIAVIRCILGLVMWLDIVYAFLYGSWEQHATYYPGSQLTPTYHIQFRGIWRIPAPLNMSWSQKLYAGLLTLSSFTLWAWILEATVFLALGILGLCDSSSLSIVSNNLLPQILFRFWEVSASTSVLVSAIVKYVLWPQVLHDLQQSGRAGEKHVLRHYGALLEHNWNVLASFLECCLLGRLPVFAQDFGMITLFGLSYVLFSWSMTHSWISVPHCPGGEASPQSPGPHFLYPFLDTTLPGYQTSLALLALLAVLVISFFVFVGLEYLTNHYLPPESVTAHLAAVGVLCALVCRFRD
jgi:hypothetical protein